MGKRETANSAIALWRKTRKVGFLFFNIIYFYLLIGLRLEEKEGEIN